MVVDFIEGYLGKNDFHLNQSQFSKKTVQFVAAQVILVAEFMHSKGDLFKYVLSTSFLSSSLSSFFLFFSLFFFLLSFLIYNSGVLVSTRYESRTQDTSSSIGFQKRSLVFLFRTAFQSSMLLNIQV